MESSIMKSTNLAVLIALLCSSGGLMACGDDDSDDSSAKGGSTSNGGSQAVAGSGGAIGVSGSGGSLSNGGSNAGGAGGSGGLVGSFASVCAFDGPIALPAPSTDGSYSIPAKHPQLSYTGRVDCGHTDGVGLAYPGSAVRVRFVGTDLQLRLRDHGTGTAQTTNYYDVVVDGGAPVLLQVSPAQELYALAEDLADGEHQIELFKRVEASPSGVPNAGAAEVLGFVLKGSALLPPVLPERRLEFIGDSITCGYGNELATTTPDTAPFTSRNENAHLAYGAVTASTLGAQYLAVAYSGRGMSRNYGGLAGKIMPELYLSTRPDDATASAWNPAQYVPDAVVINLGTNDFSTTGVDRAKFVANYTTFLETLRGYYPNAALVAALGPMLSDSYPAGERALSSARADIQSAVDARTAAGDSNVHVIEFSPQSSPWGEDWHPTNATHAKMAAQLSTFLKEILGW